MKKKSRHVRKKNPHKSQTVTAIVKMTLRRGRTSSQFVTMYSLRELIQEQTIIVKKFQNYIYVQSWWRWGRRDGIYRLLSIRPSFTSIAHLRHNRYNKFGRTSSFNRTKEHIPSEPSTTDITKLLSSLRGIDGYFCCCCVERIRLSWNNCCKPSGVGKWSLALRNAHNQPCAFIKRILVFASLPANWYSIGWLPRIGFLPGRQWLVHIVIDYMKPSRGHVCRSRRGYGSQSWKNRC